MTKSVYITGCFGFIGSYVTRACLEKGWHVYGVDKMTYASFKDAYKEFAQHPRFSFERSDINDLDFLYECDYIINTAAETHVGNSIVKSEDFVHSNIDGVHNLLELIRNYRAEGKAKPTLLHFSTDEVYGDREGKGDSDENTPLESSSYYSATKTSSDLLVMAAGRTYDFPYVITRTCNNYGENQHKEKFIPKIINSIKNGYNVPVYGDGKQVREWIHADDNAKAIYKILMSDKTKEIFNIGTGERYENIQVLDMIGDILETKVKYEFVTDRLGHDRLYSLDCDKYLNSFGKIQNISFKDWLTKEINSILNENIHNS